MNDALERGIEVIAVGTDLYGIRPVDDPIAAMGEIGVGDAILIKASRVGGLERIAQELLEH
jgi:UDP-N-acetylmuramoyl-tripeptide--D-alanyl-D-alanine ligase